MTNFDYSDEELLNARYLTIELFARATKTSRVTVRRRLNDGTLHGIKDGGIVKITDTPAEHLNRCPAFVPFSGTRPGGPGRGHRRQTQDQPAA